MKLIKLVNKTIREFVINEASFHDFPSHEILSDKYIKDYIEHEDATESLLNWFIESNGLDSDDEDRILYSQEFHEFIKEYFEAELDKAKEEIYDRIDYDSNIIKLYRAITVDDNWIQHLKSQGKRLGIYWSWDDNAAEAHWADNSKKNTAVIEAEINEKYVDWEETFKLNIHPFLSDEKEIRLYNNTPIKINSITINDEPLDLSILGNKTFTS